MKGLVKEFCQILPILVMVCLPFPGSAQSRNFNMEQAFETAIKTGEIPEIQQFFASSFGDEEISSWKYPLERGYLDFEASRVIQLDTNAILLHIPTTGSGYTGDNHDEYFDFIYRIFQVENKHGTLTLSKRAMDLYKPDFISYQMEVDIDTAAQAFLFDCDIQVKVDMPYLILKLAKEFELTHFQINGQMASYDRFGYFLFSQTDTVGTHRLQIRGRLKAPNTYNEFISISDNSFFLRLGGFAAVPSPPPDNSGSNFFSSDSTHFEMTYAYPSGFTLLQYGDSSYTESIGGTQTTRSRISSNWMDEIAFYAQKTWDKRVVQEGNTKIGFFFDRKDSIEQNYLIENTDILLNWLVRKFGTLGNLEVNFVVLNKFVKGGLLNDGHSIIAQNAEIIGSRGTGYVHEICHGAPQPSVDGNYLWIKEGFTNFLAYGFLMEEKGEDKIWEYAKRKYLHSFNLHSESLINIRSTSNPYYWAAYSKAVWIYRMIETEIGEQAFQEALFDMAEKDGQALPDIRSYFSLFEAASGKNLFDFEQQWLYIKTPPVIEVHGQLESDGTTGQVKINVLQQEPLHAFPLELEIRTEDDTCRKIIQVQKKETVFKMPVDGNEISISYDPDSRLFAIIKDHRKAFGGNTPDFQIPGDTMTYGTSSGKQETNIWYEHTGKEILITSESNDRISTLELTKKLWPVSYVVNGDTIFTQNNDHKVICFEDRSYDIAEPIYPEEFINFIFSIINWNDVEELSALYLRDGSFNSQLIQVKKESDLSSGLLTRKFLSEEIKILRAVNGFPSTFTADKKVFHCVQ